MRVQFGRGLEFRGACLHYFFPLVPLRLHSRECAKCFSWRLLNELLIPENVPMSTIVFLSVHVFLNLIGLRNSAVHGGLS